MDYESLSKVIAGFGAIFGVMIIFTIILALIVYVITSLANTRVLKYFNHKNTWGAWIPVYNQICLAECMSEDMDGNVTIFGKAVPKKYFRLWPLIPFVCGFISGNIAYYLSLVVSLIGSVIVYKNLLSRESKREETGLAILSSLFGIVWVVLGFSRFKGHVENDVIDNTVNDAGYYDV